MKQQQGLVVVVAGAIVDDLTSPTKLLAARRTAPADLAGRWELPGGKVERGEAFEAALSRELAEELGVKVQVGSVVPATGGGRWPLRPAYEMVVYWATISAGDPVPLEDHDALVWVDASEALSLDWLPTNRPIVEQLLQTMYKVRADS